MSKPIWALKIDSGTAITDATIGLYSGIFQWLENPLSGIAGNWKTDIIVENGISSIREGANLKIGGNISFLRGIEVEIDNTIQLFAALDTHGINFNGLKAELWEYTKRTADIVSKRKFWGICKIMVWNAIKTSIAIEPPQDSRKANISTIIGLGNRPNSSNEDRDIIIPGTFGEIDKAKFVRTAKAITIFETAAAVDLNDNIQFQPDIYPLLILPVVGTDGDTPPISYKIKLANSVSWFQSGSPLTTGKHSLTYFVNQYIKGSVGDGSGKRRAIESARVNLNSSAITGLGGSGQKLINVVDGTKFAIDDIVLIQDSSNSETNAIDSISVNQLTMKANLANSYAAGGTVGGDSSTIDVTMADYFKDSLLGNVDATLADNSWIQIEDIERDYEADVWKCKDYIDSEGNILTQGLELYAYDSEKTVTVSGAAETVPLQEKPVEFKRLPEYAYDDAGTGNKNKITIDVKLFDDDIDQMNAFLILPVRNLQFLSDSTLTNWSLGQFYVKIQDGIFKQALDTSPSTIVKPANLNSLIDKDKTTSGNFQYVHSTILKSTFRRIVTAILFNLPEYPVNFSFDSVYLLIFGKFDYTSGGLNHGNFENILNLEWRRFIGSHTSIISHSYQLSSIVTDEDIADCTADFYYLSDPNSKNKFFYYSVLNAALATGFANFEITGINTKELYESLTDIVLLVNQYFLALQATSLTTNVKIYELACAFRKSVSIKEAIFSPLRGRIFDDTWNSRKTAANMMESAIDQFEHICRLQNWSETGDSVEFGKEYSPSALIKIGTAAGGFDSLELAPVRSRKPAFQITEYDKAQTNLIKKAFCRAFFMVNWIDENGREAIQYIAPDPGSITPTDAITLLDIPVDQEIGEVDEPKPEDIYAEPLVRYNFNYGSQKFDNVLEILNTNKGTGNWQASYTPGIVGSGIAEALWEKSVELWNMSKQINNPPSEMTDQYLIRTYEDALFFLENWIRWQKLNRIWVPVYYDKGKNYHVGQFVSLNLPHQTNGQTINCLIEEYDKNKNANIVKVKLIMLTELVVSDIVQDSFDSGLDNWQDDFQTFAERGSGLEDKQDIF